MSLIRKHGAVLQAWACLDLVWKKVLDVRFFKIVDRHNGRLHFLT